MLPGPGTEPLTLIMDGLSNRATAQEAQRNKDEARGLREFNSVYKLHQVSFRKKVTHCAPDMF